eukprot:TRINITY_DN3815_c0_g1_i1.p1 TRINITY_DN3815_c0_g1~~TRINITY_DN3815_c0_g1_i1.p1  ORF type:complete len:340 (+),score=65.60 TRINITY_DN3815_c0_g1_i1:156-1175(+)
MTRRHWSRTCLLLLTIGAIVLLAYVTNWQRYYLLHSWQWKSHHETWYDDHAGATTAAVFVCLWECDIPLLTAAARTLRSYGGFCGAIVVVCNEKTAAILPQDFNIVQVSQQSLDSLDIDPDRLARWGSKIHRGMIAKRFKAQLLDIVPAHIDQVLFLDIDVITVSSIHELIVAPDAKEPWHVITDVLTLCKLRNLAKCNAHPFNSGVMVMQRTPELAACMQLWLQGMQDPSLIMDQQALHIMLTNYPSCNDLLHAWPRSRQRYLMPSVVASMLASNEWFVHFLGVKRAQDWKELRMQALQIIKQRLQDVPSLCQDVIKVVFEPRVRHMEMKEDGRVVDV